MGYAAYVPLIGCDFSQKCCLPRRRSLSSRRASRLSLRNCRSISALMRFCSFCSSDKQHAMASSSSPAVPRFSGVFQRVKRSSPRGPHTQPARGACEGVFADTGVAARSAYSALGQLQCCGCSSHSVVLSQSLGKSPGTRISLGHNHRH